MKGEGAAYILKRELTAMNNIVTSIKEDLQFATLTVMVCTLYFYNINFIYNL